MHNGEEHIKGLDLVNFAHYFTTINKLFHSFFLLTCKIEIILALKIAIKFKGESMWKAPAVYNRCYVFILSHHLELIALQKTKYSGLEVK